MAEEIKTDEEATKEESTKKPLVKWIIIASAVLVVGIVGFFGWNVFMKKGANEDSHKTEVSETAVKENIEDAKLIYPLESFIVNLMDNSGTGKKYLKITMELEVGGEAEKKKVESSKTQLKDIILMLLSSRSYEEINTVEGKLDLKQALLSRINQTLGESGVSRIYFTEFVVQ